MDGFSYYNIFETKGMEYLIIIAFLALLVPFSIFLNRKVKIKRQFRKAIGILTTSILKIPQGVFHSSNHTWVHLAKSGIANVGIDDLLLHITGEVSVKFLKKQGEKIAKGELMSLIEHDGKVLEIYSPISGMITGANPALEDQPGIMNEDPYGSGWIYKIKPVSWNAETSSYYLADEAVDWSQMELLRFKDFLAVSVPRYTPEDSGVAFQDGGELRDHLLPELPEEIWQDFQKAFLMPRETPE
ncbi:MAG: glycine cleavage system protein H [Bacteroidetes bacterium]|nr:glycine cleavage system protein H [Bacteroidota bacterium]